jgi:hypothetical protein
MGMTPEKRGAPERMPEPVAASGVRTEHQLRIQLREALKRNTRLERALHESAAFAYGRREIADLRRLRAILSSVGFSDPAATTRRNGDAARDPE